MTRKSGRNTDGPFGSGNSSKPKMAKLRTPSRLGHLGATARQRGYDQANTPTLDGGFI